MQSWLRELRSRQEALLQLHVNMKSLVGIVLGSLLAFVIGCAAKGAQRASEAPTATAAEPAEPAAVGGSATPQSEIKLLDEQISDDMAKLSLTRPTAPPMTCTGADCKQQLSGAAVAAAEPQPPTCKPGKGDTCTQACTIKDSICKNASRICQLALDLGGSDAYANDKCSSGNASCEAAKQRCCGCL